MMEHLRPRVLLVDDDLTFRNLVETYLIDNGYRVLLAGSALEMLRQTDACELILLDLTLPDEDGIVLLRRFRRQWKVPVIVVSGRDADENRLVALELGADDFLTKPFSPRELLLRVEHCLKRIAPQDQPVEWAFGGWLLNVPRRQLSNPAGVPVKLTRGEFEVLHALLAAKGSVVPRRRLTDLLPTRADPHPNTLTVLLSRLRRKLDAGETERIPCWRPCRGSATGCASARANRWGLPRAGRSRTSAGATDPGHGRKR